MQTINFCGDSFCAGVEPDNWCNIVAKHLDAKIIGRGKSATAYEFAIKSFNPEADYTVFLWTEAHRLYHKDFKCTYTGGVRNFNNFKQVELLTATAEIFYRQFYKKEYFEEIQMRSLYWFDKEVLSKYKGVAVHIFCFAKTYHFENGINIDHIMSDLAETKEGDFPNHYTLDNNRWFANKLLSCL
jgi:hypothetical protein